MKKNFFFAYLLIIVACNNSPNEAKVDEAGKNPGITDSGSTDRSPASVESSSFIDSAGSASANPPSCTSYTIPSVPKEIRQPTSMVCWAAVTTMMYEWKQNSTLTIPQVMTQLGNPYKQMFDQNKGLSSARKVALLAKTGMVAEPPANFTLGRWCELLSGRGPLWVTTDELPALPDSAFAIHARILYGMVGDGTPANTLMFFIDPASGSRKSEPFNDFIVKYESELRKIYRDLKGQPLPAGYQLRIQVIHW